MDSAEEREDRWLPLTAEDGHIVSAYHAASRVPRGPGLVILQEIFGVTEQLREVAQRYADAGFDVVVPALYDRIEAKQVLGYDQADLGRAAKNQLRYDEICLDIVAAMAAVNHGNGVALLGYCWGGGLAYWMASQARVDALVSYYGTNLGQYCGTPLASTACQFHFGLDDPMISADVRHAVKSACKAGDQCFEYADAGHAFANSARKEYRGAQALLAERRTLDFLHEVFRS